MLNVFNIFNGDKRTALVKKNIALSFVIKAWSCVFQFLVVPLSLLSLTSYEYGLWLTINSILMGIDSIDVGFGNGLRNKLAEALAQEDMEKARQQVSSAFFMLIITILPVVLLLSIFIFNVDSYKLLNVSQGFVCNLDSILFVSLLVMGVTFIFKFIGNVYQGLQFPAVNNLLVVIGQTISLIGLFILSKLGNGNLFTVALIFTLSPLFTYLVAYPITFFKKYRHLAPSISYFRWQSFRELFSLGVIFFIIQVSGLLLFMSSNVIITKILTPEAVTPYQIAYRYFTALYMVFIIITTPLWNATTDAYTRGDWKWISNVVQN